MYHRQTLLGKRVAMDSELESRCLGPRTLLLDRSALRERPSQHAFGFCALSEVASHKVLRRFGVSTNCERHSRYPVKQSYNKFEPRLGYRLHHVSSCYGRFGYSCSSCRPAASSVEPSTTGEEVVELITLVFCVLHCLTVNRLVHVILVAQAGNTEAAFERMQLQVNIRDCPC